MATYFFNISNHDSSRWSSEQINAVEDRTIIDFAFPMVSSTASTDYIVRQAHSLVADVIGGHENDDIVAMVQGEMTLTAAIVHELQQHGVTCVAACSDRATEEVVVPSRLTTKRSTFKFVQFREYSTF